MSKAWYLRELLKGVVNLSIDVDESHLSMKYSNGGKAKEVTVSLTGKNVEEAFDRACMDLVTAGTHDEPELSESDLPEPKLHEHKHGDTVKTEHLVHAKPAKKSRK